MLFLHFLFVLICLICFVSLFCVVSIPVRVIVWKDSSPKLPVMCCAGRKTLLSHWLLLCFVGR